MTAPDITALTTAFDTSSLVTTFTSLAPYILGVAAVILAVSIVKWGIRTVRKKLSGGVA